MQLEADLRASVAAAIGAQEAAPIGVAVSGGGDSVALLHLMAQVAAERGCCLRVVSVDHGLRAGSGAELRRVAAQCAALGVPHDILQWDHGGAPGGNLPARAREARYALMAQWARARGVGALALGHTRDDSAETLVMRLGRAAGLDGLAQMAREFERGGLRWLRPLLDHSRAELRDYLRAQALDWIEDPSNDDPRYGRARVRQALPVLADLGVSAQALHHSAGALREARAALAHYTRVEVQRHVTQSAGDIVIARAAAAQMPPEIWRRILAHGVQWIGGLAYPPRGFRLRDVLRDTRGGCVILQRKGQVRITREYNAIKELCGETDAIWDGRWRLEGPHAPGLEVRALGEGIAQIADWRATGLPRRSLIASPAVWRASALVAAPVAGYNPAWRAQIVADFGSFLESH